MLPPQHHLCTSGWGLQPGRLPIIDTCCGGGPKSSSFLDLPVCHPHVSCCSGFLRSPTWVPPEPSLCCSQMATWDRHPFLMIASPPPPPRESVETTWGIWTITPPWGQWVALPPPCWVMSEQAMGTVTAFTAAQVKQGRESYQRQRRMLHRDRKIGLPGRHSSWSVYVQKSGAVIHVRPKLIEEGENRQTCL